MQWNLVFVVTLFLGAAVARSIKESLNSEMKYSMTDLHSDMNTSIQELRSMISTLTSSLEDTRRSLDSIRVTVNQIKVSNQNIHNSFNNLQTSVHETKASVTPLVERFDALETHIYKEEWRLADKLDGISILNTKMDSLRLKVSDEATSTRKLFESSNKHILVLADQDCIKNEDAPVQDEELESDENLQTSDAESGPSAWDFTYYIDKASLLKTSNRNKKKEINKSTTKHHRLRHQQKTLNSFTAEMMHHLRRFMNIEMRQLFKDNFNILLTKVYRKLEDIRNELNESGQMGREDIKKQIFHVKKLIYDMSDNTKKNQLEQSSAIANVTQILISHFNHIQTDAKNLKTNLSSKQESNKKSGGTSRRKGGAASRPQDMFPTLSNNETSAILCTDTTTITDVLKMIETMERENVNLLDSINNNTSKGLHVLSQLHYRFSSLMQRLNKNPNSAILAEVKELELLVSNSYGSMLHAQNSFIQSCQRIQSEMPSIEEKIVSLLNDLLANLSLSNNWSKYKLEQLKSQISRLEAIQTQRYISERSNFVNSNITCDLLTDNFIQHEFIPLVLNAMEQTNRSSIELAGIRNKVVSVHDELDQQDKFTGVDKNIADNLLFAAKQLKIYSSSQIFSFMDVRDDLSNVLNSYYNLTLNNPCFNNKDATQLTGKKLLTTFDRTKEPGDQPVKIKNREPPFQLDAFINNNVGNSSKNITYNDTESSFNNTSNDNVKIVNKISNDTYHTPQ